MTARLVGPARSALALLVVLASWQLLAISQLAGPGFLGPVAVLRAAAEAGRPALLADALQASARAALGGLLIGALAGNLVATLARLLPPVRAGLDLFALLMYATPPIAIAPLVVAIAPRTAAPYTTAAAAAFFPCFVSTLDGLLDTRVEQHDLLRALGAPPLSRLRHLDLPAAVPAMLTGLQLAAPAAVLGALIGEWFGLDRGLGVLIISAMRNGQTGLLWAAAMTAALASLLGYLLLTGVQRAAAVRYGD